MPGAYVEKNEEERTVGKADKVTLPTTQPPAVGIATSASLLDHHGRRWSYDATERQSSRELQDDGIKLEGKDNPAEQRSSPPRENPSPIPAVRTSQEHHDVFTAWANRAELDKEFLLLGHNLLKIDINRENLSALKEILPKWRLSSLNNVDELIAKEDRAQRSSDKVRAKKIQLTRRIDAAVLVALKASTQLKKMTPDAIKDKQDKCKSELIQQLMSAYQEKHPSSKKSLDDIRKDLNTSEKVDKEAKQRFNNWFEEQKHACKALAKEVHSVRIKGKGLKEDYSNGNKGASDFFAVMDEPLKTFGLKLNAWGDQAPKASEYGVSSSKDFKEVAKGWISGSSVKEVPFKVDNVLKGIQSLGHKLSVQDAKLYRSVNDPTTASVTQSILWDLQQEALRFQYDCVPLMSVMQSIKKSPILQAQKILSGNDLPAESPKEEALKTLEPGNIEDFIQSELEGSQETRLLLSTELSSRTKAAEKAADSADAELSEDALIARMERMCATWSDSIPEQEKAAFNDIVDSIKHKVIPNMVSGLGRSSALLRDAAKLATNGDMKAISLAEAKVKAAVSQAKSVVEDISFSAAEKTGRAIDPFSARSRIAKDWALEANDPTRLAKSLGKPKESIKAMTSPDVHDVQKLLQGDKVFHGLKSGADPEFILFATRVAQECLRAEDGRTIMPMSPEECAQQEKVFLEFLSNWGQRKALRGIAIALLEDKAAVATLGMSRLVRALSSIVLFGGITTALKVHNAKKGLMPNNDYPYKAVQQILSKKIQQLAFRLVMTALPNIAQSAIGGGLAIAGRAHNAQVDWSGEGKKLELKNIIESAVEEVIRSAVPDGLEAIVKTNGADELVGEVLKGKSLSEDIQPTQELSNAFEQSSVTSKTYPAIARGKGEYKEAVDASLEKIASTSFGRDLLESMNQQQIRITMPSDNANTSDGDHDHKLSVGNYASPDNDTIFFDPQYRPSAEDVKDRPWLDCDPSIVLFHEMLHLYYSENPIQFEVSGQTYQFSGKGDPISEHMVAGADYVNEQGVEFRFSDPKWVKQHLKVGKYVNENDLRRELGQPIRKDYYFDARNTGANQARFYNENGEDDSFGRGLHVAMNALRSDTGFKLPKMGDFSNKEREVWDKLADDLPIKASGQVGFSLSESRFIRDHSHLYSAEKLANTIEYYHRNGLTPWYDNSASLDRDFYFRLSDITLDNGHVIESEDIQLYLELYGGPEKFVEDNVDSALGGKETLVVDMVAQRIDDIRTGQNSIASVSEDFSYRSFITDYFTKRNIKASTPVVGYHSEGHFREGNFHPHGHLTTGPNWQSGIQAFTAALESAGYTGPFKEVDFDETFYWYEGQHLGTYYDVEDLARNDHRGCIQRVEGVYVYRGAEGKDLLYVSGQIVEVPRDNGQQNNEIDMPPEVFNTLDGPGSMMGGEIKLILPRKKMETLMTVATRRDTASYTYQTSNVDYHTVQNSDVQTEFTEKLDSRFEGNNRRQIEETIERQLKYAPLMRIHSGSDSDKDDIKKWLNEFSSGKRKGLSATHECSQGGSIYNPDVLYIPLPLGDSNKYDGLMINWVRGEVIPIPRDITQRLTLFTTQQFRSNFSESLAKQNIDQLLLDTSEYSAWSKMDNISGYLNELKIGRPLNDYEKIEISKMCLDYVSMIATGQKTPDNNEIQSLIHLYHYTMPNWGGPAIEGLSSSDEEGIHYRSLSDMNNFVATMYLQNTYHSFDDITYSVDQLPTKLADLVMDKLEKDFDYHVTSASEESTQRLIESLREPLRWSSYVLAVGLGAVFPGVAAGVIGGMVTTFLTDTVLDIVQLETEDSLEKKQELLEGIIAKCYTSLGAELGGVVLGPAAGELVKWMTKTVSRKILGESSEEVMQMIDNIDLRTIQEKIDIERGVSSQNVIKTRWGRIRSRVKAENPTARARKSPITRELTEEQRTELLENQMSDTLRKYSTFDSIVDNTVEIRDVLKAAAILGVNNELMLEVDKALDPNISGNAFYQIVKMWFVYSLAGASGEVLNVKTADELLEEAMTKLDVPPQKRIEFLQKVRDERISKQRLLGDPQVQDAKAAMDSTDPVVRSTRELVGPDGRSNQEVDYYPEDNWNDEANRLMRLLDNRDLTHMAPDIAEAPLAVGEDLTPREMETIPKRQRKDGNRMQVQVDVHQQDTDL